METVDKRKVDNPLIVGLLAWIIPGLGHYLLGRNVRAFLIAGSIWAMFLIAILSGGAYYPGFGFKDGALLYLLNVFAKSGNLLGEMISMAIANMYPNASVASQATFEYGGRFLEVSGLLNFLAVIDATDIANGRKR